MALRRPAQLAALPLPRLARPSTARRRASSRASLADNAQSPNGRALSRVADRVQAVAVMMISMANKAHRAGQTSLTS